MAIGWLGLARAVQRYSFYLLVFMLPISKAAIEISFPLLLIGWIVERCHRQAEPSVWTRPEMRGCRWALGLYLAACAVSVVFSSAIGHSFQGLLRKTLEYALFFVMAADVVRQPGVGRRVLQIITASAAVVACDAWLQERIGRDPLLGHRLMAYGRMTGPYENPGDLAAYFMVVLPIVALARWEGTWSRLWQGAVALAAISCLVRTDSQGAWLGVAAAVLVAALLTRWGRRIVLASACVAIVAGGITWRHEGWSGLSRYADIGIRDRWYMWQAAWGMIQDHPIVGQGLNTFMANYMDYWVGGERQPRYAHNCFLQTAAETGLVGLATFLALLAAVAWLWLWALHRSRDAWQRALLTGMGAGAAAFLVQAFFDTNLYALRQATLFWTLIGLIVGLASEAVSHER